MDVHVLSCFFSFTSFRHVEGDRVAAGSVSLLVVNVDGQRVLGEGFETRHHGVTPLPREGQRVALIENVVGIQQIALPDPLNLIDGRNWSRWGAGQDTQRGGGEFTASFPCNDPDVWRQTSHINDESEMSLSHRVMAFSLTVTHLNTAWPTCILGDIQSEWFLKKQNFLDIFQDFTAWTCSGVSAVRRLIHRYEMT